MAIASVAITLASAVVPRVGAQPPRTLRGVVDSFTIRSARYSWTRRFWVYTPPGYVAKGATPYPLLLAFDGFVYLDSAGIGLPRMLDSLIAAQRIPPLVAVLVDDSTGAARIGDLVNNETFAGFLADEVVPRVRSGWNVTQDPRRTIITGSSGGGLASAFVALRRPELFGNVVSQSGAFRRGPEGKNEPSEWLTARVADWPKRDVRFVLDVGELETRAPGDSGPTFISYVRRFKDALTKRGYVVRYVEVPGGSHSTDTWRARLPGDLVEIIEGW